MGVASWAAGQPVSGRKGTSKYWPLSIGFACVIQRDSGAGANLDGGGGGLALGFRIKTVWVLTILKA